MINYSAAKNKLEYYSATSFDYSAAPCTCSSSDGVNEMRKRRKFSSTGYVANVGPMFHTATFLIALELRLGSRAISDVKRVQMW